MSLDSLRSRVCVIPFLSTTWAVKVLWRLEAMSVAGGWLTKERGRR